MESRRRLVVRCSSCNGEWKVNHRLSCPKAVMVNIKLPADAIKEDHLGRHCIQFFCEGCGQRHLALLPYNYGDGIKDESDGEHE